ncbi:hypothetical protein D3C71_1834710 [compost metagenome]
MADLDALANTSEHHGVIADDVAAAHGGKADAVGVARAGMAFAGVDGAIVQAAAQRAGNHLAHGQRRARWSVHLVAMVGFDDLDVIAGRK